MIKHTEKVFTEFQNSMGYRSEESLNVPIRTTEEIFRGEEDGGTYDGQRKDIQKFFRKRYFLFNKFDHGIKIDKEGWYSVTPEVIANYLAKRVANTFSSELAANAATGSDGGSDLGAGINVLDAFAGVGGNLIQFAKECGYCVGVDMDPTKVDYTRHNASNVYNLHEGNDF